MSLPVADLFAEAVTMHRLGADVVDSTDPRGTAAMSLAVRNWPVFPISRRKVPLIPNPHAHGSPARQNCKGECGRFGHGFRDATTDLATIALWWGRYFSGANIGIRLPEHLIAFDIDPRNGGLHTWDGWVRESGESAPSTLTTISGRRDGGMHLIFLRPSGEITGKRLQRTGIDLKTNLGMIVGPGSIHAATGLPYVPVDLPIVAAPAWLVEKLRPEVEERQRVHGQPRFSTPAPSFWSRSSIADEYSSETSWAAVLEPHGWRCIDHDPDADGARWLHPAHTSSCSATIRNGCLFVYSTSTLFDNTEAGDASGYTRFRAYAVLNHRGDLSEAARALRRGRR